MRNPTFQSAPLRSPLWIDSAIIHEANRRRARHRRHRIASYILAPIALYTTIRFINWLFT